MNKTKQQWIKQGMRKCKDYYFYKNYALDLTNFASHHPGGVKAIKNYKFQDITNIVFQIYSHSKESTHNKLLSFQIGSISKSDSKNPNDNSHQRNSCRYSSQNNFKENDKFVQCDKRQNQFSISARKSQNKRAFTSIPIFKPAFSGTGENEIQNKGQIKGLIKKFSVQQTLINLTNKLNLEQTSQVSNKNLPQIQYQNQMKNKEEYQKNGQTCKQKKATSGKINAYAQMSSGTLTENEIDEKKLNFQIPVFKIKTFKMRGT